MNVGLLLYKRFILSCVYVVIGYYIVLQGGFLVIFRILIDKLRFLDKMKMMGRNEIRRKKTKIQR